ARDRRRGADQDHPAPPRQARRGGLVITTHVLDTAGGRPGKGIPIALDRSGVGGIWVAVGSGVTDDDGRLRTLTPVGPVLPGTYRLRFDTATDARAGGHAGLL